MSIEEFIIAVFCLIDDELKNLLKGKKLRQRGPAPGLEDAEVISMEIVGEFFGMDCDKAIWEYFKGHWSHFFPKMPDRCNFARQAANLHTIKRLLQKNLAVTLDAFSDKLHIWWMAYQFLFANLRGRILAKFLKKRQLTDIALPKRNATMVLSTRLECDKATIFL